MELPLEEDRIRAIVAHYAHLRADYGEAFASPDLVEPNGTYFPDPFQLEPESIARLLDRMLGYAPVAEGLDVALAFQENDEASGSGCGAGACGTGGLKAIQRGGAIETETGYAAVVNVADASDPTILTTVLARAIGRIVLFEADETPKERDEGAIAELTAIASGLGILVLNGACVYKKGCGGMKRHQATFLEVEDVAFAVALFVKAAEKKPSVVRRYLEVTQKEAFDAALSWLDGQPSLVRALVERPEALSDGVFAFEEKKGLFSRFFASIGAPRLRGDGKEPAVFTPTKTARSEEEERRLAEAKALVEQALSEP
jgi:hypothetical protein